MLCFLCVTNTLCNPNLSLALLFSFIVTILLRFDVFILKLIGFMCVHIPHQCLWSLLIKSQALHITPYLYTHTHTHTERERDTLSSLIAWPQNRQHKAEYQPKETSKLLLKRRRNGGYRVLLTTFVACWRSSLVLSQHAVTADAWNEPMLCWQSNTSVLFRAVALNNHVLVL